MAKESAKGSAAAVDVRPSETPKDLKKRVRGLDKSLTSVHERLVQTEKQIFDLERSYLEETRLYGNVLQGWDAYLDTKGKGVTGGKGEAAAGGRGGSNTREAASEDGEEGVCACITTNNTVLTACSSHCCCGGMLIMCWPIHKSTS